MPATGAGGRLLVGRDGVAVAPPSTRLRHRLHRRLARRAVALLLEGIAMTPECRRSPAGASSIPAAAAPLVRGGRICAAHAEPARGGDSRRRRRSASRRFGARAAGTRGARPAIAVRGDAARARHRLRGRAARPALRAGRRRRCGSSSSVYSIGYMRANDEAHQTASTSASRWRSPARSASPSPATCSRCSSSTRC